jgi:hypothetical protein
LPLRGFDSPVDGDDLIVTRGDLATAAVVMQRFDGCPPFAARDDALPATMTLPEFLRAGEVVEGERLLDRGALPGSVMHQEAVAVAAVGEGRAQRLGIAQHLLHAVAVRVLVVLGLDHDDRQVGRVIEDATFGGGNLLPHLRGEVPPRTLQGRVDVLGADISLGELLLVEHSGDPLVRDDGTCISTYYASIARQGR